ncbi:hypothetical protein D9M71_528110 [compost metagenome]
MPPTHCSPRTEARSGSLSCSTTSRGHWMAGSANASATLPAWRPPAWKAIALKPGCRRMPPTCVTANAEWHWPSPAVAPGSGTAMCRPGRSTTPAAGKRFSVMRMPRSAIASKTATSASIPTTWPTCRPLSRRTSRARRKATRWSTASAARMAATSGSPAAARWSAATARADRCA